MAVSVTFPGVLIPMVLIPFLASGSAPLLLYRSTIPWGERLSMVVWVEGKVSEGAAAEDN